LRGDTGEDQAWRFVFALPFALLRLSCPPLKPMRKTQVSL
jgi:hypothetical protein